MIDGTYSILYIKWDGEFLPIGCLNSNSFEESSETLDTTTRDNEGWTTFVPTNQSYSISFDALIKQTLFDGQEDNTLSYQKIKELKRSRTLIEWKIESTVDIYVSSGFGYITSLGDTANVDEFISFNAQIVGFGKPLESKKELTFLQSILQTQL